MKLPTFCLLLLFSGAGAAFADSEPKPLMVGAPLPPITLPDQHDVLATLPGEARLIIFSRSMAAAKILEATLSEGGAEMLAEAKAVVVSDISRMPRLVTRFFAQPAMRKRPYRMYLDHQGEMTASYPSVVDQVTVVELEDGKIKRLDYLHSADKLRAVLDRAREPSDQRR